MIAECLHYSAVYFETLNITISDNRKKDPSRSDKSPKLAQIRRICPKDKRFDVNLLVFFLLLKMTMTLFSVSTKSIIRLCNIFCAHCETNNDCTGK